MVSTKLWNENVKQFAKQFHTWSPNFQVHNDSLTGACGQILISYSTLELEWSKFHGKDMPNDVTEN